MTTSDRLSGSLIAFLFVVTAAGGFAAGHVYRPATAPSVNQAAAESSGPAIQAGAYYAVFLTNGQVYFGNLSRNGAYLTLTDVYYLSAGSSAATASSSDLTKLGGEFQGPKDEMDIAQSQVLFYEPLRDDSPVVQRAKR